MSVHAAGVVIAPGPLAEYVPVCTAPTKGAGAAADGEESIITQYEMGALEKVGMLKMDMLGLKTLTVIHDAVLMIAARTGVDVDMDTLPFDDPKVYELLRHGPHRRRLPVRVGARHRHAPVHALRPVRRSRGVERPAPPGPLDAGMHTVFIRRKLRPGEGHLPAPVAAGGARADLRRHHLPGAGDADRATCWPGSRWPKPTCSGRRWARRTRS